MTPYEKAAERLVAAELFLECCIGDPHVQGENGKWLTREEVYERLKNGYES